MFKKLGMVLTLAFVVGLAFVFNGGQASAATEHTVTASLYVDGKDNLVKGVKAYLTTDAYMPIYETKNNAKLIANDDNTYTLSIPVVNETFALITLGTPNSGVSNIQKTYDQKTYGSYTGRITNLTMKIEKGATGIYFKNNLEYASHFLSPGDKNFNLTLDVDWSKVLK